MTVEATPTNVLSRMACGVCLTTEGVLRLKPLNERVQEVRCPEHWDAPANHPLPELR